MLVVIPFFSGDKHQAVKLAEWIAELGGVENHSAMMMVAQDTDERGIYEPLKKAFGKVTVYRMTRNALGWPDGPNLMFSQWGYLMAGVAKPEPWFWMEPDMVPLSSDWLDKIDAEYKQAKKPFMGERIDFPSIKVHLTGCSVYPPKITDYFPDGRFMLVEDCHDAFDLFLAESILPNAHFTKLIHHERLVGFGKKIPPSFATQESLALLREGAVLFHPSKDGDLIDRLREKRDGVSATRRAVILPEIAGSSPAPATSRIIYAYYQPISDWPRKDAELFELWKRAWADAGWQPEMLNEQDARKHRLYEQAQRAWAEYPTINHREYERHCYNRYLAMHTRGGGWMCDYDVFPLTGDIAASGEDVEFFSKGIQDPNVPCLIHGTEQGFEKLVYHLINHKPPPGTRHWSDMLSMAHVDAPNRLTVKEYMEDGWETAPAVHFSSHRMAGNPKEIDIPKILAQLCAPKPEAPVEKTISQQLEEHSAALAKIIAGKTGRRQMAHNALRKAGVLGAKRPMNRKRLVAA